MQGVPYTATMDKHALAVLEVAQSWDWPLTYHIQVSGDRGSKFKAITPKLLSGFIVESRALGGTLVDQFWVVVGQCHPRLEENSTSKFPPAWTHSADIPSQLRSFGTQSFPPPVILRRCYSKGSIEKRLTSLQSSRRAQHFLPIFALHVGPDTNLLRNR